MGHKHAKPSDVVMTTPVHEYILLQEHVILMNKNFIALAEHVVNHEKHIPMLVQFVTDQGARIDALEAQIRTMQDALDRKCHLCNKDCGS